MGKYLLLFLEYETVDYFFKNKYKYERNKNEHNYLFDIIDITNRYN